jgi:hypothetical protein
LDRGPEIRNALVRPAGKSILQWLKASGNRLKPAWRRPCHYEKKIYPQVMRVVAVDVEERWIRFMTPTMQKMMKIRWKARRSR